MTRASCECLHVWIALEERLCNVVGFILHKVALRVSNNNIYLLQSLTSLNLFGFVRLSEVLIGQT